MFDHLGLSVSDAALPHFPSNHFDFKLIIRH